MTVIVLKIGNQEEYTLLEVSQNSAQDKIDDGDEENRKIKRY